MPSPCVQPSMYRGFFGEREEEKEEEEEEKEEEEEEEKQKIRRQKAERRTVLPWSRSKVTHYCIGRTPEGAFQLRLAAGHPLAGAGSASLHQLLAAARPALALSLPCPGPLCPPDLRQRLLAAGIAAADSVDGSGLQAYGYVEC